MENLLPAQLGLAPALILVGISFLTSAISATFGLGGGVAMLIALLTFTPPVVALPAHAIIQIGSNCGRAAMMRSHIMPDIVLWMVPGIIVGVIIGSQVFVSLPLHWLESV
ncbi:MAG: sulfite exporter TauE/SafE family protein [Gammaproteobacteria bacterium]|nr:sulfite exporter TauE/SafE family protein [Gammaproteobacteria bacterium]